MQLNWRPLNRSLINEISQEDAPVKARLEALQTETIQTDASRISNFKVYQYQLRQQVSTSISVSPFFKGDGSYEDFQYRYFAGGFSDQFRMTSGGTTKIQIERFGLGISLDLKVTGLKSSIKGGFNSIAAAVEMKLASAQYSYFIHALPEGDFYDLLPQIGTFDFDSFKKFNALVERLKSLYKVAINSDLDLVAIEVLLAQAVKEEGLENSRSYYFAAKQIMEELSLEQAIKKARKSNAALNEDAIQYIYTRCGLGSIEEVPTSSNVSKARAIIFS